jgi:hypothetical protein
MMISDLPPPIERERGGQGKGGKGYDIIIGVLRALDFTFFVLWKHEIISRLVFSLSVFLFIIFISSS